MKSVYLLFTIFLFGSCQTTNKQATSPLDQGQKLSVLIIDGQNNHGMWPKITQMMKSYLEETERFEVDVYRTKYTWKGEDLISQYPIDGLTKTESLEQPKHDPDFNPQFSNYDVVVSNFGWNAAPWPKETERNFETYMKEGGGLVVIHAADNSFEFWPAYNEMIGLGGWGGRTEKDGPYVYYNLENRLKRDMSEGKGGAHGPQHEFSVKLREPNHPIVKGMPTEWMHTKDELYDRLRGPAKNMTVLATSFSAEDKKGTGRHEPTLMVIEYGKGRIFHTPLGHADYSVECVGFISALQRGTEWAATGEVMDSKIPDDFPTKEKASHRAYPN